MATKLTCPHCGRVGRTEKALAPDATVRCPDCHQRFNPSRAIVVPERPQSVIELGEGEGRWVNLATESSPLPVKIEPAPAPNVFVSNVPVAPEPQNTETVACYYCGEAILKTAKKCKHCGEFIDPELRKQNQPPPSPTPAHPTVIINNTNAIVGVGIHQQWSRTVAVILSLVWPGLGQIYKGQLFNGLAWMIFVILGYVLFIPIGLILHICCVVGAASGDPTL